MPELLKHDHPFTGALVFTRTHSAPMHPLKIKDKKVQNMYCDGLRCHTKLTGKPISQSSLCRVKLLEDLEISKPKCDLLSEMFSSSWSDVISSEALDFTKRSVFVCEQNDVSQWNKKNSPDL